MWKRQWKWFGKLRSDEGFTLTYGNRTVIYSESRGSFAFGFEDGFLFPTPHHVKGVPTSLSPAELEAMIERVVSGIRSDGHTVEVFGKQRQVFHNESR